jgi:sortase A
MVVLLVGLVLILTGVSILAYVGWQYYGTDIVSKRKHKALTTKLETEWRNPTVADLVGPGTGTRTPIGGGQAIVRIPAFGDDYRVPLVEGVRDSDLAKGIGHFPGTGPGQIGNFAIAGHRITHGEPFRRMLELDPGDRVIIETKSAIYTYELDTDPNDLTVSFTEGWVIDPIPVPPEGSSPPPDMPDFDTGSPKQAIITLTTCSEIFHTDDRSVAFGHLVETQRR